MKGFAAWWTDPNGYGCITKILGALVVLAGIVGYFLGKDPLAMIGVGGGMVAGGKWLDVTVKPEIPPAGGAQ
jgi:hypothetical protein